MRKKLYKDESGEYQCDVLFLLDRELFICECKAWSEPRTIIGFYNQLEKMYDAEKQLTRIANKYVEEINLIKSDLKIDCEVESIHKVVLSANAIGKENFINGTYYIDYSTFHNFILRKAPSINFYNEGIEYQYRLPGFDEYEGDITASKFMKCLKEPSSNKLMEINTEEKQRVVSLGETEIEYNVLVCKESIYMAPDRDIDEYTNGLEKVYSLK